MRIPVKESNAVLLPQNVAPSQNLPNTPAAAFGAGIANTLNSVGVSVGKASAELAQWQAKQAEIADEGILNDMRRSYLNEINQRLTSTDIDDKTQKPKGLLARQRGNAVGITFEYDGIFDEVKNKTLTSAQGLSINAQRRLAEYLEKDNFAKKINVAEYEANEKLAFEDESFKGSLADRIEQAPIMTDTNVLRVNIEDAYEDIDRYHLLHGMPVEAASLAKKEFAGKMVMGSLDNILQQEGVGTAQEALGAMKDDVKPELYNALSKKVDIWGIEAAIVDDPTKADPVIDGAKFLSPFEKEEYRRKAQTILKSREGTIKEKNVDIVLTAFNEKYQDNPLIAQQIYMDIMDKPADAQKKYNITPQNIGTIKTYMKNVLENGEQGAKNEELFAATQMNFNKFDIKDGKINNSKLNNVESIVEHIAKVNGNLKEGNFNAHRIEAIKQITALRANLADIVEKSPKLRDTKFWDKTLSETMPSQIKTFISERVAGGALSKEALGIIYEDVYKNAIAEGLDLKSVPDSATKERAAMFVRAAFERNIRTEYLLAPKEANAVLTSDIELINYDDEPRAPKGIKLVLGSYPVKQEEKEEEPYYEAARTAYKVRKDIENGK